MIFAYITFVYETMVNGTCTHLQRQEFEGQLLLLVPCIVHEV